MPLYTPHHPHPVIQGGWGFLDLEKSDDEGEDEEASSEGFDPGSEAEDDDESSEDMSDEVRNTALGGLHWDSPHDIEGGGVQQGTNGTP